MWLVFGMIVMVALGWWRIEVALRRLTRRVHVIARVNRRLLMELDLDGGAGE